MKGLQEDTGASSIFLTIKHGSICEESKTPRAGFESIEVNNPRTGETVTKYIKKYKTVEALVTDLEWYDREHEGTRYFGWKLHLDAAGVPCILDLPFDKRITSRFMKTAENIEFTEPVEFRAWHDNKSDSTALFIGQFEKSVPQKYTMDDMGECPQAVQNAVTKKWNYEKQSEWLYQRMLDVVIPAVRAASNPKPQGMAVAASVSGDAELARMRRRPEEEELGDDQIPF
jgi:hypothetical protein